MNWTPRPYDIEWTRQVIRVCNHNATWRIDRNNSVWRVDKINRVLICVFGQKDEMFEMITIIGKILGYTTRYEVDQAPVVVGAEQAGSGKLDETNSLPLTQL